MLGAQLYQKFIPQDYDVFCGIDVDKKKMLTTFTDHEAQIKSIQMPGNPDVLIRYVNKQFPNKRIAFAYEAGPTGYGLYDHLRARNYSCLVLAPSTIPVAPGSQVKTNRLDSKRIAEFLRGGQLKSIHIPSPLYRHLRHLTHLRDTYVKDIVAIKCRIKSLLLFEGVPFPEAPLGSQWSSRVIKELKNLALDEPVRFKLNQLLAALSFGSEGLRQSQREIRRFCSENSELSSCLDYLMSIPGIGWIVAVHLLARIGDWRLLENVRQIAGFLGLVSREHSTGDRISRGTITKTGDGRLRGKLIQSAWASIRRDPELESFYRNVYRRHPIKVASRKAIVAVARKLTTRIYCVLKEQRPYVVR